jgi:flagellar biosynthesis protein FlhB
MPGERTEQATQHRREKARTEGDILHSRELTAAAGTLAGVMMLGVVAGPMMETWRSVFVRVLRLGASGAWEPQSIDPTLRAARRLMLSLLAGPAMVMAAVATGALGAGLAQSGGARFVAKAIGWKPERINPLSNLRNLVSLRAAARLGKSLIPAGFLAVFAAQRVARQFTIPPFSLDRLERLGPEAYGLLLAAAWLLFG